MSEVEVCGWCPPRLRGHSGQTEYLREKPLGTSKKYVTFIAEFSYIGQKVIHVRAKNRVLPGPPGPIKFSSRTQMLTVNVMINVLIIGQLPVTAIIR